MVVAGMILTLTSANAQEKQSPKEETGYAKVEAKGTLLRVGQDKKTWIVRVKSVRGGEIIWSLDLPSKELEQAAQGLEKKSVVIAGEIVRELPFPGVGGESFLLPPPEPILLVRTLRAAEKK
jgi:hypothetical protein